MGSQASKSESGDRQANTQPILSLVRSSAEIFAAKYIGAKFPDKVKIKDDYDASKSREELIGDVTEFDQYDEEHAVSPPYSASLSSKEHLRVAILLSDVIEVRKLLKEVSVTEILDDVETPLEMACAVSQASEHFASSSLNTSVPASDNEAYSRQISQQDALDVVKLLLHSGAQVSEKALENASEKAYGAPKLTLMRLLSRCSSEELRNSYPLYEPNVNPLHYEFDVSDTHKGKREPGIASFMASDKRTEGELDDDMMQKMCIVFIDGDSHVASWAWSETGDFEKDLLLIKCSDASIHYAPGFCTAEMFKQATFDEITYHFNGPLHLWNANNLSPVTINIIVNVLDDWDRWDITTDLVTLPRPDCVVMGATHLDAIWGKEGDRGLELSGNVTGINADGSIKTQFVCLLPKLLTTTQFTTYLGDEVWHGLTHIATLVMDDVTMTLTFGAQKDALLGCPRAPVMTMLNADGRELTYMPDGAEENPTMPRLAIVADDRGADYPDISTHADLHPEKFAILQDLHAGPIDVTINGLGYEDVKGTITLKEAVFVSEDSGKMTIPYPDGDVTIVAGTGQKQDIKDEGVLVCGVLVPDSVFYGGLTEVEIDERMKKEKNAVEWYRTQLDSLATQAREMRLSKAQFVAKFEDMFGEDQKNEDADDEDDVPVPPTEEMSAAFGQAMSGIDMGEIMAEQMQNSMNQDGCEQQ